MGNGLKQFFAEATACTLSVAHGEHIGKIKGKCTIFNIEVTSHPMGRVQQVKQVAFMFATKIGGNNLLQEVGPQNLAAEFYGIHMVEIEFHILGPDKRGLQYPVRFFTKDTYTAKLPVEQEGTVISFDIGQGYIGVVGQFKRTMKLN